MIKVLVVRVDGTSGDEFRLAAAESLAKLFETHVVGLIINVLPEPIIVETMTSVTDWSESLEHARAQGSLAQPLRTARPCPWGIDLCLDPSPGSPPLACIPV